jgi:arsenate reductase
MPLLPALQNTFDQLIEEFNQIPEERKIALGSLAGFITAKLKGREKVYLNFICTHNSRRSHMAQIWAQAAASYYSIPGVKCYSGGTEATAFNPRSVTAMKKAGFDIVTTKEGSNPVYNVFYANEPDPIIAFSKRYDDPFNPNKDFAAIMTCSHAEENCPLVLGASKRFAVTYDDPKEFDDTPRESAKYEERVRQIGREMLYVMRISDMRLRTAPLPPR